MSSGEKKSLGMPLEIAKQNLRDDPNTKQIADALGVELEAYIDQVMEYALNPEKEPELEVLDDESIDQLGPEAPSVADVTKWFEQVEAGEIDLDGRLKLAEHDGFSTQAEASEELKEKAGAEDAPRRAPGVEQVTRGRQAKPKGAGSVLEQQLLAQQLRQPGMDARRAGQARVSHPKPGGDSS